MEGECHFFALNSDTNTCGPLWMVEFHPNSSRDPHHAAYCSFKHNAVLCTAPDKDAQTHTNALTN